MAAEIVGEDPTAVLLPEEQQTLLTGRETGKRLKELANGRTCARRAMHKLGLPDTPILQDSTAVTRQLRKMPRWPDGVVGSITHTNGYAMAVAASADRFRSVGVDAENNVALDDVEAHFRDEEQAWLAEMGTRDGIHWLRLLASAKESVFKAWFPLTEREGLRIKDTLVTVDPKTRTFTAELLVDDRSTVDGGPPLPRTLHGRFLVQDSIVLTAVVV